MAPARGPVSIVLARSGPGSSGARRALRICAQAAEGGRSITLVLIGDATLLAAEADSIGADVACLGDDARMRAVDIDGLEHVRGIGRRELVDELVKAGSVVGAL